MKFLRCKEISQRLKGKVAIIGAGPAGLAAAGSLICDGIEVDVFDMLPEAGGLLIFGIPEFRMPKNSIREGIKELAEKGVSFHLGKKVHDSGVFDVDFGELLEKYDALLIATGAWEPRRLNVEGEDLSGIFHAAPYIVKYYLTKFGYSPASELPRLGSSVAVIGAGLTAVDSALLAVEVGAKEVYLIYRRTRKEAPAGEKELTKLEEKGVKIIELKSPVCFKGEDGKLKQMITIDMKLGPPDKSGRPSPIPIPGSEKVFEVDSVIIATGGLSTPPFKKYANEIKVMEDGRIVVDEKKMTTKTGVFAAGDVESGPSLIGPALKSGLVASESIKEYLRKKLSRI
ncbi:MAG: FAD-dependent oxidoreductase [Thermoproteota archaeon]|nr:FAD-dependent oxidoreductase [Candidatus Brockarchaeota archaeon]